MPIKIFIHKSILYPNHRLEVSSGIIKADSKRYQNNSFVPNSDWRRVLKENSLDKPFELANSIALIKLKKFDKKQSKSVLQLAKLALENLFLDELLSVSDSEEVYFTGLATHPPNLSTVSRNSSSDKFVGLHIDSWDNLPLIQRGLSTNRICINLGSQERYLLFIRYTLAELEVLMNLNYAGQRPDKLVVDFLKANPKTEVFRLKVLPGEAYVAPTENIIHDGSNLGTTEVDQNLMCRSRFLVSDLSLKNFFVLKL